MGVINFVGDTWTMRVEDGDPRREVLRIADAMGRLARDTRPGSKLYVTFDVRPLSIELAHEAAQVAAASGITVLLTEAHCPEPALCEAVRRDPKAFGALMLTAGMRSVDYVGVRVRMADGSSAGPADIDVLESYIWPDVPAARGPVEMTDLVTPHLERLASRLDGPAIAQVSPLVVYDPMYGATTSHGARLLASLGVRVRELHDDGDPEFGGLHPEAVEPWIDDCEQAVVDEGAVMGIATGAVGGRLSLVDEKGRLVSPHVTLAMLMEHLVRNRGERGRMVAPIYVSTIVRRQAERLGLPLTVTAPGYVWMREEMATNDVVCAGDAMGGIGLPEFGLERDALAAAALLVEYVVREGKPVSELAGRLFEELGPMYYGRRDVRLGAGAVQVLRVALPGLRPQEIGGRVPSEVGHPADALSCRFEDGSWLLVRPSRTQPVARVTAEAPCPAARDALLDAGAALALSPLG